jgi:hypothetical protein
VTSFLGIDLKNSPENAPVPGQPVYFEMSTFMVERSPFEMLIRLGELGSAELTGLLGLLDDVSWGSGGDAHFLVADKEGRMEDVRLPVRFDRGPGDHATSLELFKDRFWSAVMS